MDQACTKLLAGPAFTLDQNGNIRLGDHLEFPPDHLHLRSPPEDYINGRKINVIFLLRKA